MAKGKKKLGADLAPELVARFAEWADAEGLAKGAAGNAAITIIQHLPLDLRRLAMRGEWDAVDRWFADAQRLMMREQVEVEMREQALRGPPSAGQGKARGTAQ